MPDHTRNPALALALVEAPPLAKCGPLPPTHGGGTSKSKALRAEADATARAVVETAFRRTGPTAVAAQIGLSRAAVRGWAEDGGLCLTIRDVLACPRGFARDVLEGALLVVSEEVPDTLDGLKDLAIKLTLASAELLRLAGESKSDDVTRRLILALVDQVERIAQQIRRAVLGRGAK